MSLDKPQPVSHLFTQKTYNNNELRLEEILSSESAFYKSSMNIKFYEGNTEKVYQITRENYSLKVENYSVPKYSQIEIVMPKQLSRKEVIEMDFENRYLNLLESKLDDVRESIKETKTELSEKIDKTNDKIDKVFWATLTGALGILATILLKALKLI